MSHHPSSQTLRTDVLVIGGGAAGVRAALSAAEAGASVLLVSNPPAGTCGSSFRNLSGGWGIQALVGEERTDAGLEAFYQDILRAGLGQADPALVRILVEESGPRLEDLLRMGVRFRKCERGAFLRVPGCFSTEKRAFLTESLSNTRSAFLSAIRRSSVKTFTGDALALMEAEGACRGAWVLPASGEPLRVVSPATVLATGGGAGIFQRSMVSPIQVGTGCALALEAGAELRNMEFVQLMLVLERGHETRFLPLSELTAADSFKTSYGRDLLNTRIPDPSVRESALATRQAHYPFSSRDVSRLVDLAVAGENALNRPVFWRAGPGERPWTISHAAHAFNGGIRIDAQAESTLPGLFAAGETAGGPHGADRIGGCMMTATQVFGARAGRAAAMRARANGKSPDRLPEPCLLKQGRPGEATAGIIGDMKCFAETCFQNFLGVIRNAEGLEKCLERIRELQDRAEIMPWGNRLALQRLHRLCCSLEVGKAVAGAALARRTSLGGHMRTDQGKEESAAPDPSRS